MKTAEKLLNDVYGAGYEAARKERDYDPFGSVEMESATDKLVLKEENNDTLCCDSCFVEITDFKNDLFHHTGIINGEFNDHIHLCSNCQNRFNPPVFNFDISGA